MYHVRMRKLLLCAYSIIVTLSAGKQVITDMLFSKEREQILKLICLLDTQSINQFEINNFRVLIGPNLIFWWHNLPV